ncbi:hypothetical protein ATANTOWER_029845 [Ataeniobius toweri]|uniref:Uncharacterized protein n=1 Tax=Ataeniobius toweri TaxID=208326 RepID=A0ABU7B2N4_9TELE|nr:hypothetical protein [Ataeniobius toweri]
MQEVSTRVGVPLSCVVPVKNYSEELELDLSYDILLLSAVIQMLRFVDNYFDELSDRLSSIGDRESGNRVRVGHFPATRQGCQEGRIRLSTAWSEDRNNTFPYLVWVSAVTACSTSCHRIRIRFKSELQNLHL